MLFTIPIFISFIAFTIFSYKHYNKKQQQLIIMTLLYVLFFLKLTEYTIYGLTLNIQKIPIEFSTISYFIFSISMIFHIKWLKPFATFGAFLSGLGYLVSFIFLGKSYFMELTLYDASMAFLNHAILFYTSILVMKHDMFVQKNNKSFYIFTLLFLAYYIVVHRFISFSNPYIFINVLLQGDILKEIIQNNEVTTLIFMIYFSSLLLLYRIMISIFHVINKKIYTNEKVRHEHTI
ncbi:hypothetical protein KHQ89_04245 [Mycoplasmatota bacterium]|nr:hypothetical protein KHQ89_04245 [Mycoplasmatota bacterium]